VLEALYVTQRSFVGHDRFCAFAHSEEDGRGGGCHKWYFGRKL